MYIICTFTLLLYIIILYLINKCNKIYILDNFDDEGSKKSDNIKISLSDYSDNINMDKKSKIDNKSIPKRGKDAVKLQANRKRVQQYKIAEERKEKVWFCFRNILNNFGGIYNNTVRLNAVKVCIFL